MTDQEKDNKVDKTTQIHMQFDISAYALEIRAVQSV
jgi:hypothetical protein